MALVDYIGEGGVALSGVAEVEFEATLRLVDYTGMSGFSLSGSAEILSPDEYTGSGGLWVTGSARIQNFPGNAYSANDRWVSNTGVDTPFLYERLNHQKNPLASRDSIVYIEGTPQENVVPTVYSCYWDSASEEVRLFTTDLTDYTVLFAVADLVKLDLTFDPAGLPVVVYEVVNEVWIYTWDTDTVQFTQYKIADGTNPFVCWDERREEFVATGDILVVYQVGNSIFMRKSRNDYGVEYATTVLNFVNSFSIEGFGMTTDHKMHIRFRVTKTSGD